ncbi:TolC family protein [Novosphingobium aquae]|uniref:TolC family protein n=1 Tax=Novosphingobium aquae TaxID=3133435 RepID=A0ABU8SA33_9SPHN
MKFRFLIASAILASSAHAWAAEVSLSAALAQGAETSPRVQAAKAKADAAEARARQAGASPNPELSLEVENFAGSGAFQGLRSTETTLALSQRIELGGKRSARLAVATSERDFAFLSLRAAEADLARDIRIAHAELRGAEDRAMLARENAGQAVELARTARLLVEVGRDPPLRQLRAEAVLAEAQAEEARSFGELLAARRFLADLIGSSDPDLSAMVADGEVAPGALPPATPSLDEQLAAAERDAAQARIRVARAEAVPDVTASGGVRRFGEGRETAFIAGISIPLPFRDRNKGNIEAAQADSLASEASLRLASINARRTQHDARMMLGAANARVAVLSGPSLAQAAEAVRLASIGYGAGKFSLLELLDAQSALTTAKTALIEARLDRARALAALIRAQARAGN